MHVFFLASIPQSDKPKRYKYANYLPPNKNKRKQNLWSNKGTVLKIRKAFRVLPSLIPDSPHQDKTCSQCPPKPLLCLYVKMVSLFCFDLRYIFFLECPFLHCPLYKCNHSSNLKFRCPLPHETCREWCTTGISPQICVQWNHLLGSLKSALMRVWIPWKLTNPTNQSLTYHFVVQIWESGRESIKIAH